MAYSVKVEGEVVIKDGSGRMIEFYEEEFILDISDKDKARSLIRKALITERLQKKTEGFKQVRTCQVLSIDTTSEVSEVSDVEAAMLKAIDLNCVPENIDNYKRKDHKIKALEKAIAKALTRKTIKDNVKDVGDVND